MSVFISYRRDGGEMTAQYIYEHLTRFGYEVFYDIESIKSGNYEDVIGKGITDADDVIILLPKGSMERCMEKGDMVRFEIGESLRQGKNIIPVVLRGFQFPEKLPEDISEIVYIEQHDFTEMRNIKGRLEKLRRGLKSKPKAAVHTITNKTLIRPITDSRNSMQGGTYVRRGELLDKIQASLETEASDDYGQIDKHMVVLSAMGGAGKSEMARAYAYEHMGEYLEIFWLTCTDGETPVLQTLLDDAYRDVDTNVLRSLGYESLSGYLRSLGNDSLIIIDNLNTEDWSFINEIENGTGKADIIITSRLPQIGEIETIAVESDDPALFALEVFRKNYEKTPRRGRAKVLQEDEIDSAKSICRSVSNNTMLSAMIGIRLREYPDLTVSACADKLRAGITSLTSGKVDFMKDNDRHKSDLAGILRFLYQDILSHKFEREEAELIALLSLYPATWFDQNFILRLLGGNDTLDYEYSANELLDLGWLQGDGIQITIHPLIAEVIQTEAREKVDAGKIQGTDTAQSSELIQSTDASFCGKLIEHYLEIPVDDQTRNRALIYRIYQNAGLSDENQKLVICAILNIPDYRTLIRNLYPEINAAYLAVVEKSGRRKYVLVPLDGTSDAGALPGDVSGENHKVLFECAGNNEDEDRITLIRLYDQGKPYVLDLSGTIDGISLTAIPDLFCYDNNNVTDVIFSAELKSIGNRSFFCCRELKGELNLPDGVITIGDDAFLGCSRLSGELHLPDSVTTIGNSAFYHCRGLSGELHLPDHVTTIGNRAFSGCTGLSGELHLPDSVTTIGNSAFSGCSGLSGELHLPDSVTTIGDSAFSCCSGLSGELHIPDSVTTIGNSAFYLCDGLSGELHIPGRVSIIGDSVFSSCSGLSGELHLPDGVTTIGNSAFRKCSGLSGELHLPDSLTTIGDSAFSGCSGLSGELHIPDSVTTIGNSAFARCNVKIIASERLTKTVKRETEKKSLTPSEKSAYEGMIDKYGEVHIPEGLISIGDRAFFGHYKINGELHLPDSLTTIGDSAFSGCKGLSGELHLPDGVTTIGDSAFSGCSGLSGELHLPDSVTTIGNSAFRKCSGLSGELHLPDNVTTIGNWAFSGCSGLSSELQLPERLTAIGKGVFSYCSGLTGELHIPDGVTTIGELAFEGCSGLSGELHLPDSLITIGVRAFSYCSGLSGELHLPKSVTTIGELAFFNCSGLSGELHLPDNVTTIDKWAFSGCIGLSGELRFPKGLKMIGDKTFLGCKKITKAVFLNPETEISLFVDPRQPIIIAGYKGSTAEAFALSNNLVFEEIR